MEFLNPDGSIKFFIKNYSPVATTSLEPSLDFTYLTKLYSCNIQTNIVGESIKIDTGYFTKHIMLSKITYFSITNNLIKLTSSDYAPFYLEFVDKAEALKAYDKFEEALNGDVLQCTESLLEIDFQLINYADDSTSVSFPGLVFVDTTLGFRANSYSDLIAKLNQRYLGFLFFSALTDQTKIKIQYNRSNSNFLFEQVKILSKKISLTIDNSSFYFNGEFYNTEYYIVHNNRILSGTTLLLDSNIDNSVEVFYKSDNVLGLEINNTNNVSISGTFPHIRNFVSVGCNFSNLTFFNTDIETISISNSLVSGTVDFTGFTRLKMLEFVNCTQLNTITGLNSTVLSTLKLTNVDISTFPDVSSLTTLNSLYVDDCSVLNAAITIVNNLQFLSISNTPATSISISSSIISNVRILNTLITALPTCLVNSNKLYYINISLNDNLPSSEYTNFLTNNIIAISGGSLNLRNNTVNILDLGLDSQLNRLSNLSWQIID